MSQLFKTYYVYLLTNKNHTVIYTGVTNDIERRVTEHKQKVNSGLPPISMDQTSAGI